MIIIIINNNLKVKYTVYKPTLINKSFCRCDVISFASVVVSFWIRREQEIFLSNLIRFSRLC